MKGVSLLLSCLCFILLEVIRNGEAESPLALYIAEEYYKLESLNEIKQNLPSSTDANSSRPLNTDLVPKALLCCSDDTTDETDSNRNIFPKNSHFVTKLISKQEDLTNSDSLCENKLQPSINDASEPATNFITDDAASIVSLQSGYWVCDRNGILKENSLNSFKKHNNNCDFFSTMEILFNSSESIARQVRYDINIKGQHSDINDHCENFNVGIANLTNGILINEAYENHIKQDEALRNNVEKILVPSGVITASSTTDSSLDNPATRVCGLLVRVGIINRNDLEQGERDYFIKQPLAPTFHFEDNSLAFTVCSLQNTAPMWNTIAESVWIPMQKFVQDVAKKIGKLSIITGTKDTLKSHKFSEDPNICLLQTIKLGEAEVAVPRKFWIVAMYHFTDGDANTVPKTYGMILVANNDRLQLLDVEYGCEIVECKLNGWPDEKEEFGNKLSYCCKFNENNLDYFNIKISLKGELSDLNVNNLPIKEGNSN